MVTITEDYVSFEVAKLLREKGFDERGLCVYVVDDKELLVFGDWVENSCLLPHLIAAPTLQMAMKWLREVHNILIVIDYAFNIKTGLFYSLKYPCTSDDYYIKNNGGFKSYKNACEAAIKYCLENII